MKSTMQWIVKSSLALALVAGVSLAGTLPAHAIALYNADLFATLTWSGQEGIQFGPFANFQDTDAGEEGAGDATSSATVTPTSGAGFLTVTVNADGATITPPISVFSDALLRNLVRVENVSDVTQEVPFDANFVWTIQGMTNPAPPPLLVETAFAAVTLDFLTGPTSSPPFTSQGLVDADNTAPPPFDNMNMGMQNFNVFLDPGQVVWVGLEATARGEAQAEVVPEPTSILLLGSGMIGLGAWRWRQNKRNQNAA